VGIGVCVDVPFLLGFRETSVVYRQFEGSLSSVGLHLVELDRSVTIRIRAKKGTERSSPVDVTQLH